MCFEPGTYSASSECSNHSAITPPIKEVETTKSVLCWFQTAVLLARPNIEGFALPLSLAE